MKRIFLYGGSFNPPGLHHEAIVQSLSRLCEQDDVVVVIPCGFRPDKGSTNTIDQTHRARMCEIAFGHIKHVTLDLSDLSQNLFRRTIDVDAHYKVRFPDAKIIHVIGSDLIQGGAHRASEIQATWVNGMHIWNEFHFLVVLRDGYPNRKEDLPPHGQEHTPVKSGASSEIRAAASRHESLDELVSEPIATYMHQHSLYQTHGAFVHTQTQE